MTAALEGVSGQQHAPAALYPREGPGSHFTGGWVGPRAGLDGRKISPSSGFDPGPSSPKSVAILTELPGPQLVHLVGFFLRMETAVEKIKTYILYLVTFPKIFLFMIQC